jgi:cytochrome c-type biogenesis protein CcmH
MTIFWILVAGLAGLALLFVLAPLLSGADTGQDDDIDLDAVNLDLFKQQVAELDADLAAGKLDQSQYDSARQDLEREALANIGAGKQQPSGGAALPSARLTALALLVAVPASTLALYLTLGSQDMITRMESGAVAGAATAQGHSGAPDGMPPLDVLVERLRRACSRPGRRRGLGHARAHLLCHAQPGQGRGRPGQGLRAVAD